jgi:hypothetical protein
MVRILLKCGKQILVTPDQAKVVRDRIQFNQARDFMKTGLARAMGPKDPSNNIGEWIGSLDRKIRAKVLSMSPEQKKVEDYKRVFRAMASM